MGSVVRVGDSPHSSLLQINNPLYNILKFTRQSGGQSDIV